MRRLRCVAALLATLLALAACDSSSARDDRPTAPATVPLPDSLTAFIDQSRLERVGRSVFVRLIHEGDETVTVTRAEVSSDRFGEVTWTGEKSFTREADLDLVLPVGTCGTGSDADVRLTYRLDDGPEVVSTTRAVDRYGAIALFLQRDCAEQALAQAADLTVGPHRVVGTGRDSVFVLPVTLAPTGSSADVAFTGFQGTVLFQVLATSPVFPEAAPVPLVPGDPIDLTLRLVPARCDPHALAEDKVGTLIGVHVAAPGLPDGAASYLPISDEARAALRGFFSTYCEL